MADKYINSTGLLAIKQWIEGKFALDADLDTLDAKVDSIIAEGGEPNTIESISVNGTAVAPDAQKNVALTVPTATSDLTNDSDFVDDANYVHTDNNYTTAEKTKLEGVETGAEVNVIETVKVNGTALTPDAQKAVNVEVPNVSMNGYQDVRIAPSSGVNGFTLTQNTNGMSVVTESGATQLASTDYVSANTATLTKLTNPAGATGTENTYTIAQGETSAAFNYIKQNESGSLPNYLNATLGSDSFMLATTNYVDVNGGKIDKIKVNGTEQTITNKEVDITVPTKTSDLTNDSNYQDDTQVDAKIASAVASAVTLKGSVATYSALPSSGQKHGDMYDVLDTGRNYVWLVEEGTGRWDDYAGTMDMSAYWISTTGQSNTLEAMTVAEINAILEPSA